MTRRFLEWEGCVNVRDLGDLPLRDGGVTPRGAIVRSDNVQHLTAAGWEALHRHGVRSLVDLRFEHDRREPDPPVPVAVAAVSLFGLGGDDPDGEARLDRLMRSEPDAGAALAVLYVSALDRFAEHAAAAVAAVAEAPDGGVVVHCFVGKDRTGIVTALLLDLAGVEHDAIVDDYALTDGRVGPLIDGWIAQAETDDERTFRQRISAAPAGAMAATLEELTRRGGARVYLRTAGLDDATIDRATARLRR